MTTESNGKRVDIGDTLRDLRKAAGLSGERLAARCAMSQTKISRIERKKTIPTVVDVERILKALEVPPGLAKDLLILARRANVEHASLRALAEVGLWRRQAELKAITESCTIQREFLPAIPSDLLQTAEYARAVLTPAIESSPARNIDKTVAARLDGQSVLSDISRRFIFLLTEQAVRWRRASRSAMAHQCDHMAHLTERPNIDIAIIPVSTEVHKAPLNTFVVYDDRLVLAENFSGDIVLRDPKDIAHHRDLFDFFYSRALTNDRARAFLLTVRDEFM
ncbi:MAG TPA: helix-turn-helix transcriptional regulator [Pseudonocardiaceae bacterium]|nr:helix-turn-helix transcriptional regulator [Pseudonocardiaceae bacterium]